MQFFVTIRGGQTHSRCNIQMRSSCTTKLSPLSDNQMLGILCWVICTLGLQFPTGFSNPLKPDFLSACEQRNLEFFDRAHP